MSDDPTLRIIARLNFSQFDVDKRNLLRDLAQLEANSVAIGLDIDASEVTRIQSLLADIDANIGIRLNIDDADLRTIEGRLAEIDTNVNLNVSVADGELNNAVSLASLLDGSASFDVAVNESELEAAQDIANDLDGSVALDVGVNDEEVQNTLTELRNLQAIELAFTIGGPVASLLMGGASTLFNSSVGGIIEMDNALAVLEARTGTLTEDADKLINDIFIAGWGESRGQIAEVVAQAQQLGVPFEDIEGAVTDALSIATIFGEDVNQILRTQENLVRTGLVDSYEEAGDVITSGFQNGVNAGDDLLDTLNEYGTTFSTLGIDGQEALSLLNAGLRSGIDNTDRIADAFREFNIRITEGSEEVQTALSTLGIEDLATDFRNGELAGDEFIQATIAALSGVQDPAEQSRLAVQLFGTQFEDFDAQTFIDALGNADNAIIDVEGSLDRAQVAISNTLPAAWDRFTRVITTGIGTAIDEQFNISGLLDELTGDVNAFFDSLQSGDDFTTAFRVAFDDNEIVDVLVTIREVLSDVFFAIGGGLSGALGSLGVDTTGLDMGIQSLALAELEIDMATIRNPEDATNAVRDALSRGIDVDTIVAELNDTWATALETNDIELLQASAEGMMQAVSATSFTPEEIEAMGGTEVVAEFIASRMGNIQEALGNATDTIAEGLTESLNLALSQGDLVGALNIDEQLAMTGNTLLSGGTMQSAQFDALLAESGLTFEELTQQANDGMQAVSDYSAEAIDASIDTTATNWETATGGMATDMVTFRDSAVADYQAIEEQAFITTEAMRGQWALVGADIGGINLALGDMANNLLTMPSVTYTGAGGGTNYNQTVNNNQSVTMNNATAAAAAAGANSTAEIVGGGAPSFP